MKTKRRSGSPANSSERLHRAGTPWRDFATFYRQHNHRDRLAKEIGRPQNSLRHLAPLDPRTSARARRARLPSSHQQIVRRHRLRPRPRCSGVASRTRRSRPPAPNARAKSAPRPFDVLQSPQSDSAVRSFAQSALPNFSNSLPPPESTAGQRRLKFCPRNLIDWLEITHLASPCTVLLVSPAHRISQNVGAQKRNEIAPRIFRIPRLFRTVRFIATICLDDEAPGRLRPTHDRARR